MKPHMLPQCKQDPATPVRAAAFPALAVFVLCGGCGSISPQRIIAASIQKRLPALIGPAQSYSVSVDGDAFDLSRGAARKVAIHGTQVQVSPELTLDDIAAEATNVRYDRSVHKITHIDATVVTAAIGTVNLSRYLSTADSRWSALQVEFTNDHIVGELPLTILQQTVDVKLTGHFTPDAGNPAGLDLVADSASIAGIPAPASLVNLALNRLNPVVNLSRFKYPVRITDAAVRSSRLVVSGSIEIVR